MITKEMVDAYREASAQGKSIESCLDAAIRLAATPVSGAEQMREACAKVVESYPSYFFDKPLADVKQRDIASAIRALPLPVASPAREADGYVTWSDEHYARARDCAFDILSKDGYGLDRSKFDNAFQHAVGILALPSTKTDGGGASDKQLNPKNGDRK